MFKDRLIQSGYALIAMVMVVLIIAGIIFISRYEWFRATFVIGFFIVLSASLLYTIVQFIIWQLVEPFLAWRKAKKNNTRDF